MKSIRRYCLVLIDSIFLVIGYSFSYTLCSISSSLDDVPNLGKYTENFAFFLICLLVSRIAFGLYHNIWRYASVTANIKIILSDFIGALVAQTVTRIFFSNTCYFSVWISFTNVIVFTVLTLSSRFAYQFYNNHKKDPDSQVNKIGVAIVGAGMTGSLLAEELLYNTNSHYHPQCFIDVDNSKIGGYIYGVKIIEESKSIINTLRTMDVKEIFIALPKLSSDEVSRIYDFYSQSGCKIKLYDFAISDSSEFSSKRHLREIKIEDLLFRDSIEINDSSMSSYYNNKVILVTGGGGSIGSEICRQIAKTSPKKLIVFDIYENNAYDIEQEFKLKYGDKLDICTEIGSVRDRERLDRLFAKYHPDIVFHAAAHKHVPLMENSSGDAIKNNVFGTYNTVDLAEKFGVKKFILISTDKAVNPTNVMGATKRLCEMIVQSRFDSKTTEFAAVRFGNVLGSNGSVIPLFKKQIESGGPITITDKRIIRYFMTIPEASQLVLQAGAMASSGELFVLDMGNPVKIIDLAVNMIKLAGYTPYKDIDIVETGLRPGEKLYEELLIKTETLRKTNNDLIFVEKDTPLSRKDVEEKLNKLKNVINADCDTIRETLKDVVPTYHSPASVNKKAEESHEMKLVNC